MYVFDKLIEVLDVILWHMFGVVEVVVVWCKEFVVEVVRAVEVVKMVSSGVRSGISVGVVVHVVVGCLGCFCRACGFGYEFFALRDDGFYDVECVL